MMAGTDAPRERGAFRQIGVLSFLQIAGLLQAVSCAPAPARPSARQERPICRIIGGYTIRCRNGLIAAI
jgi:hypothetical protein